MRLFDAFGRHKSERLYSTMNNWALSEIGPWTGFSVDSDELISHLLKITQEYPWVIIFSIDGVKVNPIRRLSYGRHPIENIDERIKIYQFLLEQSLKQSKSKLKAILPISVVDDDPLPQNFPVLSFQKKIMINQYLFQIRISFIIITMKTLMIRIQSYLIIKLRKLFSSDHLAVAFT